MNDTIPTKVIEESKKIPTYFVFYQPCSSCKETGIAPITWNLKPVFQIKSGVNNYTSIYKIE